MIREAVTAYGIWWAVTRVIKWMFILGWPGMLIGACANMLGSNPDKWSESTKNTVAVISLCISVPVYLAYRRHASRNDQ